jgi:hypothetical protein
METGDSSETSLTIYHTTCHDTLKDDHFYGRRIENLKSRMETMIAVFYYFWM